MDIVCKSCETVFKGHIAKDFTTCPVCGAVMNHFDMEDKELQKELEEADKSILHFSKITETYVVIECSNCNRQNLFPLRDFEELEGTYVKMKPNVVIDCFICNYKQKGRYITFGEEKMKTSLGPHCPKCNSIVLKKISLFSKFVAAGVLGSDAIPHNRCTYECVNCGHRF